MKGILKCSSTLSHNGQGYLPLDLVAQSSIQAGLQHFQGLGIHNFSACSKICPILTRLYQLMLFCSTNFKLRNYCFQGDSSWKCRAFLPATLITFSPALHSPCALGRRDLIIQTSMAQAAVLPVWLTGCCAGLCQQKPHLEQGQKFLGLCLSNGVEIAGGGDGKGSVEDLVTIFCWTKCLGCALKSCSFSGICQLEGFLHGALSTACQGGLNSQRMALFSAGTARQRKASETFPIHFARLNQTHILVHAH